MGRHPKQSGATVKAATGSGGEGNGGGSAGNGGAGEECHGTAEEGEKKVLNEKLMEQVLDPENLRAAYLAVKANKGAAGIDGIGTEELGDHLRKHWPGIKAKLEEGRIPAIPGAGGGDTQKRGRETPTRHPDHGGPVDPASPAPGIGRDISTLTSANTATDFDGGAAPMTR